MNPNRILTHQRLTCRLTVLALAVATMTGCQPEGGRQLAGKWKLDATQSLAERMKQGGSSTDTNPLSTPVRPGETGDISGSGPEVSIAFQSNGRLETLTRTGMIDSAKTGTWRLVSYNAEKMTALIECTLSEQVTEHEIEWLDKDSIKLTPPNMAGLTMKLIFRRAD